MSTQRYWICIMGPVDAENISADGDSIPRIAAREAMEKTTGVSPICASGWVNSDRLVAEATYMAGTFKQ